MHRLQLLHLCNMISSTILYQAKRDSFSDSGAEGSGTNTPTRRGVTMTEGLLRFVQDGSVVSLVLGDGGVCWAVVLVWCHIVVVVVIASLVLGVAVMLLCRW